MVDISVRLSVPPFQIRFLTVRLKKKFEKYYDIDLYFIYFVHLSYAFSSVFPHVYQSVLFSVLIVQFFFLKKLKKIAKVAGKIFNQK